MQDAQHLVQRLVAVALALDHLEGDRAALGLHDLELPDGVVVVLEHVREEGARARTGPCEPMMIDCTRPSILPMRGSPRPHAQASFGIERLGQIADAIADERQAVVVEVGDDHLADLARRRRPAVLQHLDDVALADDVMARVRLALVGDAGELARAVLVEHLAAERLLDRPCASLRAASAPTR